MLDWIWYVRERGIGKAKPDLLVTRVVRVGVEGSEVRHFEWFG